MSEIKEWDNKQYTKPYKNTTPLPAVFNVPHSCFVVDFYQRTGVSPFDFTFFFHQVYLKETDNDLQSKTQIKLTNLVAMCFIQ